MINFEEINSKFNESLNWAESMAKGCIEKFDFEFMKWIIMDGRSKKLKTDYLNICKNYKDKIIICKSRKDVNKILEFL